MKIKVSIKIIWRRIRVFMIWMQIHHFKNFVMFWIRILAILIMLALAIGIWFTDNGIDIGIVTSLTCLVGAGAFYMGGRIAIKRLHKKYLAYVKNLKTKVNHFRSIF